MTHRRWAHLLVVAALLAPAAARAEVRLSWRGELASDLRLNTDQDLAFERSDTSADAWLAARLSRHVNAKAHLRAVFSERAHVPDFAALTNRSLLDTVAIESDELYVELIDIANVLDLRVGRQQLIWGSADRFHPVSNLNPLALEDRLAFGDVLPNEMVTLSLRPGWSAGGDEDEDIEPWLDEVLLQLVFVPFFKPAELPQAGGRVFTDIEVFSHRANTRLTRDLVIKQDVLETQNGWTFDNQPSVNLPANELENSQFGARLSARLLGIDLGVSYYRGFEDIPRAEGIIADTTNVPDVTVEVALSYPRVQVFGVDAATSIEALDGLGLWTELAVTYHDDLYRIVSTGPAIGVNGIEVEHAAGSFIKAVVGVDYTPVPWLYLNAQYLHGFVDEFGEDELHDYLVAGADIHMVPGSALLRFFNVFSLLDGSYTLFPQLILTPFQGGELSVGALLFSSAFTGIDERKKFASRANGESIVFLKLTAKL